MPDDTEVLDRIHTVIGDLPTYGMRRQLPRPHRGNYSGLFVI